MQLVLSSPDVPSKKGASTPWAQYFSLLPQYVPVPTMWSDAERAQLRGTSLEVMIATLLGLPTPHCACSSPWIQTDG